MAVKVYLEYITADKNMTYNQRDGKGRGVSISKNQYTPGEKETHLHCWRNENWYSYHRGEYGGSLKTSSRATT